VAGDQNKFQKAMMHAERFSQEGKWAEAMKAYRFALAEFPNNEVAIVGFGKSALNIGQVDIAQKAFQQALKINPSSLETLANMADVQERMGQLDAAAETYLRMGNVYVSRHDLDSAIDSWTRATQLASGHVEAQRRLANALAQLGKTRVAAREYLTLAAIYQRRNDLERSLEQIEAAQELLPDDPGIIAAFEAIQSGQPIQPGKISDTAPVEETDMVVAEELEEELFDLDDLFGPEEVDARAPTRKGGLIESIRSAAMGALANTIFEDSDNPGTMMIMQALGLQSKEEITQAISHYNQAIQLGSRQPALYFNLGLLYKEQGQLNETIDMLKTSAQDPTYKTGSEFALGESYFAANRLDSAVKHFLEALRLIDMNTVSGHTAYQLAQQYKDLAGNFMVQAEPEKISRFVSSLQNFFSDPNWERKAYEARQRMNDVAEQGSMMSLAEFLETPETEVMITTLALTNDYIKANLLMTASEECLRAIQGVPHFLPLHIRLGDILLKLGHTDEAITKFLYICRVYQMRGQPEQAINLYNTVLQLAPMDVTVRSKLIDLYISQENLDKALQEYLILANSYYQLAQVDRALEKYNEALRLTANLANGSTWKKEALIRMADIYTQRFDWANATAKYEQLLETDPNDEAVLRKLVDLYYKQNKLSEATSALDSILGLYQRQTPLKALELLQDLSSIYSNDMFLRQKLAVAYAQNNMTKEAIAEYDILGEMQLEKGLRDQAIQTIQAIINLGPDDIEGYRRLLAQISGGAL
jgi:tetratricopeptide (TPR) repeat protein